MFDPLEPYVLELDQSPLLGLALVFAVLVIALVFVWSW